MATGLQFQLKSMDAQLQDLLQAHNSDEVEDSVLLSHYCNVSTTLAFLHSCRKQFLANLGSQHFHNPVLLYGASGSAKV